MWKTDTNSGFPHWKKLLHKGSILALSVTFGASSPKGRAFGSPRKLHLFAKASPFGRGGCERSEQTERARMLKKHPGQASLLVRGAVADSLHHIAEHQLCDLEIEDQAAGVHDGGDEGGSHNSGVGTQLFGGKRQHTAH